jgi:peptide deformylase
MAILKVANIGNPILRRKSPDVSLEMIQNVDFQKLIDDMVETMREYDGVGLAASQVHVNLRIFTMEVTSNPRYPDEPNFPLTIVINPIVTVTNDSLINGWEGCLSIPGLRGNVPRVQALSVEGLDRFGERLHLSLEGFPARIVQHETDHLNGMVYIDKMSDLTTLSFQREYERFHLNSTRSDEVIS